MSKEEFNIKEAITSDDWLKIIDVDVQKGKELEAIRQMYDDRDKLLVQRISDLEAKLAEKEKLLEINERILRGTKLVKQELEKEKISFAVEQLEKVKETTECVLDNALKNSSLNQSYYDRLLDEIDNQIKAIKGEK